VLGFSVCSVTLFYDSRLTYTCSTTFNCNIFLLLVLRIRHVYYINCCCPLGPVIASKYQCLITDQVVHHWCRHFLPCYQVFSAFIWYVSETWNVQCAKEVQKCTSQPHRVCQLCFFMSTIWWTAGQIFWNFMLPEQSECARVVTLCIQFLTWYMI
jgi:hypothetical protein